MSPGRLQRARDELRRAGVDALVVGPSADLRYLTGYDAPLLERLTALILRADAAPAMILPELERPRAEASGADVELVVWGETEDPFALIRDRLGAPSSLAVGDHLWATFVLRLQQTFPAAGMVPASRITGALRIRKDAAEVDALARAASAADRVAATPADEKVSGRTEREVSRWIAGALDDEGSERTNFAIVASGPNAASPHHEPSARILSDGDALVCDFGGTADGYCSDITRTFAVSSSSPQLEELHRVLSEAQEAAVAAVGPGVHAQAVDAAARRIIDAGGFGEYFIHRTGHGIGLEVHEEPYIVEGNEAPLEVGMAFSVEPGIYLPGRCGARIEDIVVVTEHGHARLNEATRDLVVLA
jgi:Xaa-Pro aminopeptidase